MATAESTETDGAKKSVVREYLESLVVALILALFIRTFVVQAFKIPTGSMEQNLLIGDHLLVNKVIYSPSAGGWEDRLLAKREVKRGDVVIFKYPEDPSRDFIKRVVGLPGEEITIRGKTVYIDSKPLEETYTMFIRDREGEGQDIPASLLDETRGDVIRDDYGPAVVPPGKLFVLGDNRDNSKDSRYWGFLPRDQVKGRALLVYWSYEASKEEYGPGRATSDWLKDTFSAVGRTRWKRFFHMIR